MYQGNLLMLANVYLYTASSILHYCWQLDAQERNLKPLEPHVLMMVMKQQ